MTKEHIKRILNTPAHELEAAGDSPAQTAEHIRAWLRVYETSADFTKLQQLLRVVAA